MKGVHSALAKRDLVLQIRRREFLRLLGTGTAAIATAESLAACGGGGGQSGASPAGPGRVIFFPNPGDTSLAFINTLDGRQVTLFGNKNSNGLPVSLTDVIVDSSDKDPRKRSFVSYDSLGRPTTAALAGGASLSFDYISSTQANLTFISATGTGYGPIHFDGSTGALTRTARNITAITPARITRCDPPADSAIGRVTVTCSGGSPVDGALVAATYTPSKFPPNIPQGQTSFYCVLRTARPNAWGLPILCPEGAVCLWPDRR